MSFKGWKGPPIDVLFYIPPKATKETPVFNCYAWKN